MARLQKRSDQEWIDALTGRLGQNQQSEAFQALAKYLYIVAFNNLRKRRSHFPILAALGNGELTHMAEDFVQQFMEKMLKDNFVMLTKFSGRGRFVSWAAQITINLVASELRKVRWQRRVPMPDWLPIPQTTMLPDALAMQQQLRAVLQECLDRLPERSRTALIRFVVEGDSAPEIAEDLGVTANTVHILVYRAKKKMQIALKGEGIGVGSLGLFTN